MEQLKAQVLDIIADYKGVSADTLDCTKEWSALGFDSLDVTELMIRLEDKLGVEIDFAPELNCIDALVEYIGSKQ